MNLPVPAHWLDIAKKINAIAQTGLAFSKDIYDRERYQELQDLSVDILNRITEIDTGRLDFIFNRDDGYQTPKLAVRVMVCRDKKILMVKEKLDGLWSMPGGYADPGLSPGEIAVKEVKEESGFDIRPLRILALLDYNKRHKRHFPFNLYNLYMAGEIMGGNAVPGVETSEVDFFDINELPPLSVNRSTKEQNLMLYALSHEPSKLPIFD